MGIDTLGGFETLPAAGIRIVRTTGITVSEYGATDSILVALTSPPTQNVVLTIVSQNTAEVKVVTPTRTFTPLNWDIPQAVTVIGVDDAKVDGHQLVNVTISVNPAQSAGGYSGVDARMVVVTNLNNDLSVPVINGPAALTAAQRPTITWTIDPGAAGYDVWIRNSSTQQNPYLVSSSSTNSFSPPSDLGIGVFDVWVRSFRSDGIKGAWSARYRIQINTPVSVLPVAAAFTTYRPTIIWNPLVGAVRYDVWVGNLTTGQNQLLRDMNVLTPQWTPPVDLPISAYRFWVRAIDASGGFAAWSVASNFRVVTAPTPIGPLASTFDRTPTFEWSPVIGGVTYRFQLRNLTTGASVSDVPNLKSTSWTASAVLPDGKYRWWAMATGVKGFAASWSVGIDFQVGAIAQLIAPFGAVSTTPTLNWVAVGGAIRYELQVNRLDVPQGRVILELNLTGTSYTVTNPLVRGGAYRAWIRAVSATGEYSRWSQALDFRVLAAAPLDAAEDDQAIAGLDPLLKSPMSSRTQCVCLTSDSDSAPATMWSSELAIETADETGLSDPQNPELHRLSAPARSEHAGLPASAGDVIHIWEVDQWIGAIMNDILIEGFRT